MLVCGVVLTPAALFWHGGPENCVELRIVAEPSDPGLGKTMNTVTRFEMAKPNMIFNAVDSCSTFFMALLILGLQGPANFLLNSVWPEGPEKLLHADAQIEHS